MIAAKVKTAAVDQVPVTLAEGRNARIDAKKLLEKGVSSDVILFATVSNEYNYVVFGKAREETDVVEG
jgi:hypothetical protein